jgi:predicted lipoprotein with Yx(FWY)xxD motif
MKLKRKPVRRTITLPWLGHEIRLWSLRRAVLLPVAAAGFAFAALLGSALAKSFALKVAKNATVTNQSHVTKHENIAVNSRGSAVYLLTGDSKRHPECTKANGCFGIWKPIKVTSKKRLSKAPGIHGKLGIWRRNGILQVTLGGHPLYRFVSDHQKLPATGEGIRSFGGTWHVIKAAGASGGGTGSTTGGTTNTMPTTTGPCLYPPC